MIRAAGHWGKMGQSGRTWLLKSSVAKNCALMQNQQMSGDLDQEIFGEILSNKTPYSSNASASPRQMGAAISYFFKSMDFVNVKNKRVVKEEIREALNNTDENLIEHMALKVIKSCGGPWFDVGKDAKNNVLTRFMDAFLSKNQITSRIGNRLLLSYTENKKDFDSKLLLKSFLDSGLRPNNETYCAIIQLEIARGNFESALDVYKFCVDQNLDLLPSAALSLVTGSVVKERPSLTSEFERVFDSVSGNFRYKTLLKSLAVAIGHAERGSAANLEDFIANSSIESSIDYKSEFLKAFCFVYKALAERKSNDSVAQCKQFMEQMKPNISPELFLADKILGVTCSHLYANKCVEASLELKKSIPQGAPQLWSKISDELLASSVLANDKDPLVMLVAKFRGFKDSQILNHPLTTLIGRSIRDEDKMFEIPTMMSSFLENPEVEVKPHFYFPFFIFNAGNSLPPVSRVMAFCECLEQEPEEHFRFTAENLENILISQPLMLEHLLNIQNDLIGYPKYNCVLIEVLLKKQRFAEAVLISENMLELPRSLALKLINSLLEVITHGDVAVAPVAKVFGKCYRSLSETEKQQTMENLIADFNAGVMSRSSRNTAINLFNCLREEKCFMKSSPALTKNRSRDFARIDGAYQTLFHPDEFLQANVFSRNVLKLSEENRRALLHKLTSENFAESEFSYLPDHQKNDKIIILNASLGNFEPLENYFAVRSEGDAQAGTLMASDGRTDLLLEILLEADKTELAMEVLKNSRSFNQMSGDKLTPFFSLLKTRSQLEAVQKTILSFKEKRSTGIAGNFAKHLLALNEKDLLKSFAERCMAEMSFSYPLYIYFSEVCKTDSLETCKEIYDLYHQKFNHNLLRQPMVTACVRFSSSPLSKEILTQILKTSGSTKENEFSAGDVLLAYLQAAKFDKAKEFAKNRLVSIHELHLQQLLRSGDVESTVLLAKVNGNCVGDDGSFASIANFVFNEMKTEWNKIESEEIKHKHREFCKTVLQALVDERAPISRNAFVKFHQVANWVGVNVPMEYTRRYMDNFKFKLWISVNNGNILDALKAIESSQGKIVSQSKELAAIVDLIGNERDFNIKDNYFLDFLAFNRTRLERGAPRYFCNKLLKDHDWDQDTFQSLLKIFAVSELNEIHRSLLMGTSRLPNPVGLFSHCLPFYLTYNNDNFATYAVRNFVQTRSARIGTLVLSRLHKLDPTVVDASPDALSSAISLVETELLNYLSKEEIDRQLLSLSGQSSTSEDSASDDTVTTHDDPFDSEFVQVSQ